MTVNRLVAVALTVAVAAGCGGPAADPSRNRTEPKAGQFTNPVDEENFPDPGVLRVDGTYYAYSTNSDAANVPLQTSTDLVHWTDVGDVLPQLGSWARQTVTFTWAPEVLRTTAGGYVLYYTARSDRHDKQCIGRAVSASPRGPFVDSSSNPLVCQVDEGGSIDASPFLDADGTAYLYWKNDGNCCGLPTYLYGQRLDAAGTALVGNPARLLTTTAPWQGKLVEAPHLYRRDGRYYLFYSANAYDSDRYAVGYATCTAPLQPCRDAPENPILDTGNEAAGPGHSALVEAPNGDTWLLYHAWPPDAIGAAYPGRTLWLDRVDWVDGRPVVRGPTSKPQAVPGT